MKIALKLSVFALVSANLLMSGMARAEQATFQSPEARALADATHDHPVYCFPSEGKYRAEEDPGFFPVRLIATAKDARTTQVSIETADPKVGFGYGGDEIDPIEATPNWFIVSVGDDGRRHLFLERVVDADTAAGKDAYACERDAHGKLEEDGDIWGTVTEIWDAGTIHSVGVQCCIDY